MRSKLFVPGSRPELFVKALAGGADGLSFDLEDAVREERKEQARANLVEFLSSEAVNLTSKSVIVRINPMDTSHFEADLQAMVCQGVDVINLPKAQTVQEIIDVSNKISAIEATKNLPQGSVRLLINIETPLALRVAHELAAADPRVMGLQVGLGDLFEPFGIDRKQKVAVQQALFQIAMAAHEAGIEAYDGAFANIADREGFEQEAMFAKSLGYQGKSCIHPSQVETVNAVFRPTDEEIAFAQKVVSADEMAEQNSVGAYMVEGRMIDAPFVDRARKILASASQYGLIQS
ncbi:HpcH/HpaI aldolase/citrate lyase family protein [Orrella sp. 11846]|uniref:HpcH/HpaI aldolase/citrate lyase family protein n=1 Tax=Orrella sp. 11846 TaxID=3409913 RepID=UPI003B598A0F